MNKIDIFAKHINDGYSCAGDYITLGCAMVDGTVVSGANVNIPLRTMNRHGLIAGATGTGKTKTLQVISEQLSEKGVPVLLMDVKGDLSGIAMPGAVKPFIIERHSKLNLPFIGIELNEEECKKHLGRDGKWFEPTTEWDQKASHDRLWS